MSIIIFVILSLVAIKFIQQIVVYIGDLSDTYRGDVISKHMDRLHQQYQREELVDQYRRNNMS